ncbi:unnamed protein product [Cylicocyclus nassatus]|uniref:Uncharacterized protein n=1 Tax=Cylicocyclus nassatus TaxID=53992 RepID=A0AA36DSH8_CYLNA|nr:unnamed protein product [Cylicocyclus nassatus]
MVTGGSSLVINSSSLFGRIGSLPPPPSSHALFSLSRFRNRLGMEMNEIIPDLFLEVCECYRHQTIEGTPFTMRRICAHSGSSSCP